MNKKFNPILFVIILVFFARCSSNTTTEERNTSLNNPSSFDIIAYYSGGKEGLTDYPLDKIDQIIYSFLHLKGNQLAIDDDADSLTLLAIAELKNTYPKLKVLVSLGGWGGCETCSPIFETGENRQAFAKSVKKILIDYDVDGIDLDWEYPAIEGPPGHPFIPEDKQNFTALVQELRKEFGDKYELSFAAGGFEKFLIESIEWSKIMPLLDRVNLMSYDLINGYSTETGHHTGLYSNPNQKETTDNAVQFLDSIGVPMDKIVIGAAFYARIWKDVPAENNGLYQPGVHTNGVNYQNMNSVLSSDRGFKLYWDSTSMASFAYSSDLKQFATFDNPRSIAEKVKYAKEKGLGGIMFWELRNDKKQDGLLDKIYESVNK